jgi:hypothetical protein
LHFPVENNDKLPLLFELFRLLLFFQPKVDLIWKIKQEITAEPPSALRTFSTSALLST